MGAVRILNKIKLLFKKHPFLMNVASYGTMCVSAEVAQQTVRIINSKQKSIDLSSVGRFALIGTAGIAPFLFNFYKCLDYALPAVTKRTVIMKVASDLLMCSPTTITIFFTGMGVLEGKEDVFAELKAKFWSTYKMSCCFWLPAQAINFALLPPYTRVAFVGVASFIWVNVLCLVKRQEISETKIDNPEVLEKAAKD
ncbi:mpv17-like protein isoform X1 [Argiope bruennichi]|uniref:mpv17-like protein isoform X1 n=1 Tax=Argiope bruennichi TaxID=94029 RepID=UPI002494541E|nr:mpv17-like protein isoform X1 [Argiope bruennichi]